MNIRSSILGRAGENLIKASRKSGGAPVIHSALTSWTEKRPVASILDEMAEALIQSSGDP
jgi:hypothetical protein